jgi:hypothetical protein
MELQHMSMTSLSFFSGFGDGSTCAGIYGRNMQKGRNREHAVRASKASRQARQQHENAT